MALIAGPIEGAAWPPAARLAAGLAALCGLAAALHLALPLNHDAAWMLQGAARILDGGAFGREIVDVNPPLSWWIGLLPAGFARLTALPAAGVFVAFVIGLAMAACALTAAALRESGVPTEARRTLLLIVGAALLLAPGYDFGQREHLMLVLSTPYVALASLRAEGRRVRPVLAATVGIAGGLGFCLKPHFLAVPALLEAWLLVLTRRPFGWLRVETAAVALVAGAYLVAIQLFAPEYLAKVLPEAVAGYWAYNNAALPVALAILKGFGPVLGVAALLIFLADGRRAPPPAAAFLVAGLGAAVAAFAQLKGWSYHLLPAVGFGAIAGLALTVLLGRPAKSAALHAGTVVFFVMVIGMPSVRQVLDTAGAERVAHIGRILSERSAPGDTVYAFVTSPRDVHPSVLAAGRTWAYAACCLHLIPAATRTAEAPGSDAALIAAAAAGQAGDLVRALAQKPPAVVLVDAGPDKLGFAGPFDYLDWFARVPGFAAFWAPYREVDGVAPFRVFVRPPPAAG